MMLDTYEDTKDWNWASQGVCNVFLALSWNDDVVNWAVSAGEPHLGILSSLDDPQHENYLRTTFDDTLTVETPNSAVILNLTRLFLRVQENIE
ncbi:MAG: hypothetical protein ACI909_000911 [Planctomycetota bacterium]|jgi:hypothetical protein